MFSGHHGAEQCKLKIAKFIIITMMDLSAKRKSSEPAKTFFHPLIYTSLSFIVGEYSSSTCYDGNRWQLKVSRAEAFIIAE